MVEEKKVKKKSKFFRKLMYGFLILLGIFGLFILYVIVTLPDVEPLENQNPKTTAVIEQRKKEAEENRKPFKLRQKWVNESQLKPLLKQTVLTSEDESFYEHEGIDYDSIKESIKKNIKEGKISRGGSTITQQLAKNLFLSTEQSYTRKIKEFFIAKSLERHLTKERILYLYLNVIEFGNGIFGVGAASDYFFGKPVSSLNLSEIVRLVSIIPKPLKVSPTSNARYLKWHARILLRRLKRFHYITQSQFDSVYPQFQR